jgi:hypothetical protein
MGIEFVKDERDKKMAGGEWDPLRVDNKDPNYHYRWLRKEKLNMARKRDFLKYEIVDGSKEQGVCGSNTPLPTAAPVDGTVEVGDLVLARIPKELHEEYRKRNKEKINALAEGVSASFKAQVPNAYEEHKENSGAYPGSVTRDDIELEDER